MRLSRSVELAVAIFQLAGIAITQVKPLRTEIAIEEHEIRCGSAPRANRGWRWWAVRDGRRETAGTQSSKRVQDARLGGQAAGVRSGGRNSRMTGRPRNTPSAASL